VAHDDIDAYEATSRRLPEAHSLALRLKSAGVPDEVVCGDLHIEPEGLETLLHRVSSQGHPGPKQNLAPERFFMTSLTGNAAVYSTHIKTA
jgi:hypothetical protein